MKTINKIITKLDCKYGAPMGRPNVDNRVIETHNGKQYAKFSGTVFDCAVPLSSDGAYDKGCAYWGLSDSRVKGMGQLRVSYTKDLTYINFYRL